MTGVIRYPYVYKSQTCNFFYPSKTTLLSLVIHHLPLAQPYRSRAECNMTPGTPSLKTIALATLVGREEWKLGYGYDHLQIIIRVDFIYPSNVS